MFPIREQAERGECNYQLQPVCCIALLDFVLEETANEVCEVFYDKLIFIFIEMPRFQKKVDELKTHFDK
jgi:hypothetical protein